MTQNIPSKVTLHRDRAELELRFGGQDYTLSAELLRVCSPSAEVQGHGPDQKSTPIGKENVGIEHAEAQGNYAIRLIFDDGHDSGIFSWSYLYDLCLNQAQYWQNYQKDLEIELAKVEARKEGVSPVKWIEP